MDLRRRCAFLQVRCSVSLENSLSVFVQGGCLHLCVEEGCQVGALRGGSAGEVLAPLESEAVQGPISEGAQGHLHPRRVQELLGTLFCASLPPGKNLLILASLNPAREFRSFSASSGFFIIRKIINLTFSAICRKVSISPQLPDRLCSGLHTLKVKPCSFPSLLKLPCCISLEQSQK